MNYSKLYKRLFSKGETLTRDEVDNYISRDNNRQVIEEKALADDFDYEALEGFVNSHSDTSDMQVLDKHFSRKWKVSFNGIIVFLLLLTSTTVFLFLFDFEGDNEEVADKYNNKKKEKDTSLGINSNEALIVHEKEVDEFESEMEQIGDGEPKRIVLFEKENFKEMVSTRNEQNIESEESFNIHLPLKKRFAIPFKKRYGLRFSYGEEVYISDFKVIDYSKYRTNFDQSQLLSGLPAQFEHSTGNRSIKEQGLTYEEALKKGLSYFKKQEFLEAIQMFREILEVYPSDKNALFYKGVSFYEMGEWESAINSLKDAYSIEFFNFYEEAKWYESLCLESMGELNKATELWKQIAREEGFYAAYALEKL